MANLIYIFLCLAIYQTIQASALPSLKSPARKSSFCECGAENGQPGRIVGGKEVRPYRYPWMALIVRKNAFGPALHCGGSLINSRYILTAAHCIFEQKAPGLLVHLGLHNLKEIANNKSIGVEVERLIVHEKYNDLTKAHDLGLLKLKKEIEPAKYSYICLPEEDEDYTDKKATTAGWGKMAEAGNISRALLEVNLTVISMKACKDDDVVGHYIIPSMICTMEEKKDACQGDSGGPLMLKKEIKGKQNGKKDFYWEEIGLVSFGYGCARPNIAAIFTRLASFDDWIYDNTQDATYCMNPDKKQ